MAALDLENEIPDRVIINVTPPSGQMRDSQIGEIPENAFSGNSYIPRTEVD